MNSETIEISGELAADVNEAARTRGVTLRELVIHLLLQYLEEISDSDEATDEDLGDEADEDEDEESSADGED